MTKRELATQIAQHMNRINNNVDVKRMTEILNKTMSMHELECCLKGYNKR